jgi:hypothetical protein
MKRKTQKLKRGGRVSPQKRNLYHQKGGDYIYDRLAAIRSDLKKADIVDYCTKFVNYKKAMAAIGQGEQVSLLDCYKKQLDTEDRSIEDRSIEDRSIVESTIRDTLLSFSEKNDTKGKDPIFHTRLLKLIEVLGDENRNLSTKLITFLLELSESEQGSRRRSRSRSTSRPKSKSDERARGYVGGKKKPSKKSRKKQKNFRKKKLKTRKRIKSNPEESSGWY